MGEATVVKATDVPKTILSLKQDFISLGIKPGDILLVHSSLSKIGWVVGGAVAVIDALMDVLTEKGTLVMPTQSGDYSDPKNWGNPPVPDNWKEIIRNEMPPYRPEITPTRGMGKIPETFRKYPDVIRSNHPQSSFAAWGSHARYITSDHDYQYSLGENSPIGKIYELEGKILLIGVTHEINTSFHLAEYRADFAAKKIEMQGSSVIKEGKRIWTTWDDININSDDFAKIGEDYEKNVDEHQLVRGNVGDAEVRLISIRDLVDFAVLWMEKHRK
ncbi:MAG: aminoglycoside N(3)-acetyltransferase [Candidatus Kariarchaeaceae archaeon]|jgi:aminoglycoside 3-N-acetyltransferase